MIKIICTNISGLTYSDYQRLYEKASEERKTRADRYRRAADSYRCVVADALLRYALGASVYTIEKTPSGKPFVGGREDFYYNLSHSGNWVVIAFGETEVGVDVEELRSDTDMEAIARRFFAPDEQRYVLAENSHQRFYEVWTGKESYLKYLGTGLQRNLSSFSVFGLEPEVRLHHRMLDEHYSLSLCTTCDDYSFALLDLQRLL